jgi:hypothetical protein
MMADGLDAVAVGITEEGRIIGGVIVAQARRPGGPSSVPPAAIPASQNAST